MYDSSQSGAKPLFWQNLEKPRLFSLDTVETSNYQNLPMYHFQKQLSFAIFSEFDTCHNEITIDSLFGSPCNTADAADTADELIRLMLLILLMN